jgi:hypothetical protein
LRQIEVSGRTAGEQANTLARFFKELRKDVAAVKEKGCHGLHGD